jgi:hypothetical protein
MSTPNGRYGVQHKAQRELWERRIAMGGVECWRCGKPIVAGQKWHLGHDDRGERHVGPECPGCNVKASNALRAEDARRWREQRAEDRFAEYRRILAVDPSAREHPDWPGVIIRDW